MDAGATLSDVVKATIFILDMNDFSACNEVWLDTFSDPCPLGAPWPWRNCLVARRPKSSSGLTHPRTSR